MSSGAPLSEMRQAVLERRASNAGGTYYASYLKVDELLSLQQPKTAELCGGVAAHEEMLFIITHQAYELWFKQLLHELHSVRRLFDVPHVDERDMGVAVSRLSRVAEIEKVLIQQITVLETMSALDFLAFRDVLFPASGFQSVQFRLVENALGLEAPTRLSYGGKSGYCSVLHEADAAKVLASEAQPSLFVLVEKWLERTPFLEFVDDAGSGVVGGAVLAGEGVTSGGGGACSGGGGLGVGGLGAPIDSGGQGGSKPDGDGLRTGVGLGDGAAIPDGRPSSPVRFSFWAHYSSAISAMLSADEAFIRSQTLYTPASRDANLRDIESQRAHFELLLNPELYEASRARGERRLSHRATQAALMIIAFQREPLFQLPYRLITALLDIDELLCAWRGRHSQMVHRMLGAKLGTGGSSGYSYLRATVDRHRIFTGVLNLLDATTGHQL